LVPLACVSALALSTWAVFTRAFLNYDTLYALLWGRDLVDGRLPDYDVPLAPTPHPLATAVGAAVSLLGTDAGYDVMLGLAFVSFAVLLWLVFRLGQATFSWPVGLLAALVVATRVPIVSQAARAYVDIPFLALIVGAALLEVERPRRGWPVLALLALAGLLRPEAWLLSTVYWLYLARSLDDRARLGLGLLALSAPLLWALSDLIVTGDALHSLTGTRDTAETLGRVTGVQHVPEVMSRRLGEILRLPALVGGVAGFFLAVRFARERALVPAALAVLGGAAFVVLAIAGLPLIGRYLFLPAAMLAIFFGFAALGWLGREPVRSAWAISGLVLLGTFVAFAPANVQGLDSLRDGIQLRGKIEDDLSALTNAPQAKSLLHSCSPLYVPNHRPVPILAYYLDRPPDEVISAQVERPRRGLLITPANATVRDKFILDPRDPRRFDVGVPAGFQEVVANRSWKLYERGCTTASQERSG
jgi:hypothetical protein